MFDQHQNLIVMDMFKMKEICQSGGGKYGVHRGIEMGDVFVRGGKKSREQPAQFFPGITDVAVATDYLVKNGGEPKSC